MRAKIYFLIGYMLCGGFSVFAAPVDSIGIEKKGNKITVLHKVEEGQSLFSILKRYNSSFAEFYKANPSIKENQELKWQEIVKVPYHKPNKTNPSKTEEKSSAVISKPIETPHGGKIDEDGIEVVDIPDATPKDTETVANSLPKKVEVLSTQTPKETPKKAPSPKSHTVVSGEHLFSIAQKYGLKTWQLRLWNNLPNDILKIGQKLVIEKPANMPASQPKTDSKPTIAIKKDTSKAIVQGPAGDASKPKTTTKAPTTTKPNQPVPNAPGGRKINDSGIAEIMEGGEPTTKFLAFHKTAPIGTLVIVKNEANGQSVWVKVIGKLSESSNAIVKISPKAYERLQTKDRRIKVSTSYTVSN